MKNNPLPTLVLIVTFLLCAENGPAVTPFSDKFTSTAQGSRKPNRNRWRASNTHAGEFVVTRGKLSFNVAKTLSPDIDAYLSLKSPLPMVTEDWEVTFDVVNTTGNGIESSAGISIQNAADGGDSVYIELCNYSSNRSRPLSIFVTNGVDLAGKDIFGKRISGTKASLRASYSKSTKFITLWYRPSSRVGWTKQVVFSPFNDATAERRENWNMNPTTGRFRIVIAGYSSLSFPSGSITLDNFSIR